MNKQRSAPAQFFGKRSHHVRNAITFIGFLTTVAFRLWGFSSFICALILYLLRARPRQYVGVIIADIVSAVILYFQDGFYTSFQKMAGYLTVFSVVCLIYWLVTLEWPKDTPEEKSLNKLE